MMDWKLWIALLSFAWILAHVNCQLLQAPPSMYIDRTWQIPDNEPVGSKIAQAHGEIIEGYNYTYGLEPIHFYGMKDNPEPLPFRIDPNSGMVYLNQSLAGKGGKDLHLYVTMSNGALATKTEVYVNILNSSSPYKPPVNRPPFPNSGVFSPFGGFNPRPQNTPPGKPSNMPPDDLPYYNNPPAHIANNPPPMPTRPRFQEKTYPDRPKKPGRNQTLDGNGVDGSSNNLYETTSKEADKDKKKDEKVSEEETNANSLDPTDSPVKSPELGGALIPILAVCAIFFTIGVVAVVFRKRINLGKSDEKKDDMRKESTGTISVSEEPSIHLHDWRGPRALSNRYEMCQGEEHHQLSSEASFPVKNTDPWEFPRHRLKFFNILGEGAFGQVWKCEAMDLHGKDAGPTIVAVKTLKENANEKEKSDLLSELQVMKMLEPHPNVVKLLGCCTDKEPVFLIMEYITRGKLQSYLRNSRAERYYNNMHGKSKSLTSRDLTSFCYQVARGMEFLSANGIIHRDLAARNILITDEHACKVADFGFARDVIASHVYERKSEGRLPIRWMSPESLYDNIFSVKSDVWSFGILIWEVVTLGSTPYPGISAADVMKKVRDGYRLDKPEHCRRELYNIMYYCWDKDPKKRPSFTELVELLEKLIMTETDYIELERFPDHSYYNMMSLSGEKL
ncbi:tyrosine kinase receptor Cad96Ca [Sitophilus oryzae]|uniref:receptor protein-tyrosine kinase n=1 Tax=Sitophilus oryzae TaxID=7048 RepID=A0A6J2XVI1_SITOR|nr:tyrosine kinase receptor Cad96Ca [Sitophilus oryzae]